MVHTQRAHCPSLLYSVFETYLSHPLQYLVGSNLTCSRLKWIVRQCSRQSSDVWRGRYFTCPSVDEPNLIASCVWQFEASWAATEAVVQPPVHKPHTDELAREMGALMSSPSSCRSNESASGGMVASASSGGMFEAGLAIGPLPGLPM